MFKKLLFKWISYLFRPAHLSVQENCPTPQWQRVGCVSIPIRLARQTEWYNIRSKSIWIIMYRRSFVRRVYSYSQLHSWWDPRRTACCWPPRSRPGRAWSSPCRRAWTSSCRCWWRSPRGTAWCRPRPRPRSPPLRWRLTLSMGSIWTPHLKLYFLSMVHH